MNSPEVQPLPVTHRRSAFLLLVGLFVLVLPFLFLYAAGYRLDFGKETGFVSTGGIYVAAERTGAEIYIDGELVRETRTFRRAFYAQGLEPGTHRVHVQKDDHHTWVKELPVYSYLVTEALAFNLPLLPTVRIISPWRSASGETVLFATSTLATSTTNEVRVLPSRTPTSTLVPDTEYATLVQLFEPETVQVASPPVGARPVTASAETVAVATTTKEQNGARLFEQEDDVFAKWVGSREEMPYYYCAEAFELAGATPESAPFYEELEAELEASEGAFIGPVQSVSSDTPCDPVIKLDRGEEEVRYFDFYPDSTDLIILALESGIYVVEVDNRAWQNKQPLVAGKNLDFRVLNNTIYVYDGTLIYQIVLGT